MHARSRFFWLTFIVYPQNVFLWKNLFSFCVSMFLSQQSGSINLEVVLKILLLKLNIFGIWSIFNEIFPTMKIFPTPLITAWLRFILIAVIPRRDIKYEQCSGMCWRIYVLRFLNYIREFCENRKLGDAEIKVVKQTLIIQNSMFGFE